MGYMTVISVLNDAWDEMKDKPNVFIENIQKGMHDYNETLVHDYSVGPYANYMEVHASFHSSESKLLLVGLNHMEDVENVATYKKSNPYYLKYKLDAIQRAQSILDRAKENIEQLLKECENS